ncbi:SGNH/GDSL hydrolase family protein [Thermodesulfobacteriota bacterium]
MALGGSTTECLYLDQSETWTSLLQETLNGATQNQSVWVGNAGMSGRTTRHHLMAFQYMPFGEFKIDAVILLIGFNDFTQRLARGNQYDRNFLESSKAKKKLMTETFTGSNLRDPDEPFYKNIAIVQQFKKVRKLIRSEKIQDEAGMNYIAWRGYRRNAVEIIDELPLLSSALAEYAKNINDIINLAQMHSVRLIFMTQPTLWRANLDERLNALLWFGWLGEFHRNNGNAYYSATALQEGMHLYNETLLQVCKKRNMECLDLAPMLEKDTSVFYDDVHFNENGAKKVAWILSDFILRRTPFKGS